MTDDFQGIAQSIVDGINSLFSGHPAAAVPGQPVGHVTVPVIQPPTAAPAVPAVTPCGQSKPCVALPGPWTVASMTAEILRNEGGYVDDPSDSGGSTNYGITLGFMSTHRDIFGLGARKGPILPADVKAITTQQAASAYIRYFYQAARYDQLPNVANIPVQLYDLAVNTGVRYSDSETQATRVLQRVIGGAVNGQLDVTTINRLNTVLKTKSAAEINNAIVEGRIDYYKLVVKAHPADAKFLAGWTNRANKYKV